MRKSLFGVATSGCKNAKQSERSCEIKRNSFSSKGIKTLYIQKASIFSIVFWLWIFLYIVGAPSVNAEVEMNKPLDKIPDSLVLFDTDKKTEYAVVVQKSTQELFLFAVSNDVKLVERVKCSTGENNGPKQLSGDRKTPEGVYFFLTEYEKRELSETYGTRALPIDYPNIYDKFLQRSGNAIWLHGTNKPLKERDSNGCIVLENKQIDKISKYITLNNTPMVIVEKINWVDSAKLTGERRKITDFLDKIIYLLEKGGKGDLSAIYKPKLLNKVRWPNQWVDAKASVLSFGKTIRILHKNRIVLKHQNRFTALFDEYLIYDQQPILIGKKKIFVEESNPSLKIMGETYQQIPSVKRKRNGKPLHLSANLLYKAVLGINVQLTEEKDILNLVNKWVKSWSSKDIDAYASCYSESFRGSGKNKKEWIEYKDHLNAKYAYISVSISPPTIRRKGDVSAVSFIQNYKSSGYSSKGNKKLILRREGNKWKIYRESYQKI